MVVDTVFIIHTCNWMVCTQMHTVFEAGLPIQIRHLTLTRMSTLRGDNQPPSLLQYIPTFLLPFELLCGIFSHLASRGPHYSSPKIGAMSFLVIRSCGLQLCSIETSWIASTFIAAQLKSAERGRIHLRLSRYKRSVPSRRHSRCAFRRHRRSAVLFGS